MTTWALLAPGPSASIEVAERLRGFPLGVVSNAYQLAPLARFVAATDSKWWRTYPEAKAVGISYTMHTVKDCHKIRIPQQGIVNSGVLGLECAKRHGATTILLCGFDMHGSHFFGKYENGLSNTTDKKREVHLRQYAAWGKANPGISVINLTEGSALQCFQMARLDDLHHYVPVAHPGLSGEIHGGACEHTASHGGEALHQAA